MIDSGATALFISKRFVERNKIFKHTLPHEIVLYNIDGTKNQADSLQHFVQLQLTVGTYTEQLELLVTNLGPTEDVILGLP